MTPCRVCEEPTARAGGVCELCRAALVALEGRQWDATHDERGRVTSVYEEAG